MTEFGDDCSRSIYNILWLTVGVRGSVAHVRCGYVGLMAKDYCRSYNPKPLRAIRGIKFFNTLFNPATVKFWRIMLIIEVTMDISVVSCRC